MKTPSTRGGGRVAEVRLGGYAIEQASEVTSSDVPLRGDQAYMTFRAASSPLKQMMLPL